MEGKKMFRVLVLRGAVLALSMSSWACSGNSSSGGDSGNPSNDAGQTQNQDSGSGVDAGQTPDSGQAQDSGQPGDAGACTCVPDPQWPGQDCTPPGGGTAVCCWLGTHPPCCP